MLYDLLWGRASSSTVLVQFILSCSRQNDSKTRHEKRHKKIDVFIQYEKNVELPFGIEVILIRHLADNQVHYVWCVWSHLKHNKMTTFEGLLNCET